jgi:hypothetical protein
VKIAFLNLCHTDPAIVARAAVKLTEHKYFDMYVHIDAKSDIQPFESALSGMGRVHFTDERVKVYWGGFNAIRATVALLRQALASPRGYDYYVILQNLDYPTRSNDYIYKFFEERKGTEFIRACHIARTKDWHYSRKYKIYNKRDDDFYIKKHSKARMCIRYIHMMARSIGTIFNNGVIKEKGVSYNLHYGAAQWAVTRGLAQYFVDFYDNHPKFNKVMAHIQFPDEEYFHTIVHNSEFKYKCVKYDEPFQRWLVNWRNLHYYEYPDVITVLTESDYDKIMAEDALFIRKVRTGESDGLMDKIDAATRADTYVLSK